jgi:hypothetical protein
MVSTQKIFSVFLFANVLMNFHSTF